MKFSFGEVLVLISIALLAITAYDQYQKLEFAKDTIFIQGEAIQKQQELINHQIRYINFIEMETAHPPSDPIFRGPL